MELERSPTPFELVKATKHHGPYIVNSYGGTVCDFYVMSDPTAWSVRNGGTSKLIPFTCADGNAEFMWRAANAHEALVEAVTATRRLVSEAATTGFNWKDGDWVERLYSNQASLSAALALATAQS